MTDYVCIAEIFKGFFLDVLNERKALIHVFIWEGEKKSCSTKKKLFVYIVINKMFLVYETEKNSEV